MIALALCMAAPAGGAMGLGGVPSWAAATKTALFNGADVSWLPVIERGGSKFYDSRGKRIDPLLLMKRAGLKAARVRLWVNPAGTDSSIGEVLSLAKRIKKAGLTLVLDLHYSDWWADPGHQTIPEAWAELTHDELQSKVATYTRNVLSKLIRQKTPAGWVQIGNEVANGLLWPQGQLTDWQPDTFAKMTSLLNSGVTAARSVKPQPKVLIHLETGGDAVKTDGWLTHAFDAGLMRPDAVGLSYYSQWSGGLDNLRDALDVVANKHGLPVIVAETAYPFTRAAIGQPVLDPDRSAIGGFAISSSGQAAYTAALGRVLVGQAGSKAVGVWWWEGFAPNAKKLGWWFGPSVIANSALVSGSGRALPAMKALAKISR